MRIVDAREQACPQPVILTRKALASASELLVIVDNEIAQTNVSRMAAKAGHHVEAEHKEDGIYLHIVKAAGPLQEEANLAKTAVVLVAFPVTTL